VPKPSENGGYILPIICCNTPSHNILGWAHDPQPSKLLFCILLVSFKMHCTVSYNIELFNFTNIFFAYRYLSYRFLRRNHDKVSATMLGSLSAQLLFTGTLSVVPFSKWKDNKKTAWLNSIKLPVLYEGLFVKIKKNSALVLRHFWCKICIFS